MHPKYTQEEISVAKEDIKAALSFAIPFLIGALTLLFIRAPWKLKGVLSGTLACTSLMF